MAVQAAPSTQGTAQVAPAPVAPASASPSASATPAVGASGSRVLRPEDLMGLAWRSVGPANMSGRVADIAIAPGNHKTFFVAFGTGGLWKTTNSGTTLAPVFDKEATASIGSVVVCDAPPDWPGWKSEPAPATPPTPEQEKDKGKAKIVWVGTGEGNGRNSSSWGAGVYRSTDGGGTFTNVGLSDSHDIPRMAVDPKNPDVCYVAALGHLWGANRERGVYKTADGGKTWKAVLQIDENTGACDIIMHPQNSQTLYAAMYMRRRSPYSFRSGGPQGGIYRTTDGGATWKKLAGGLPAQTGRIGLDIYAKDPRVVYAIVEAESGGWGVEPFDDRHKDGGVFRSDDGGDTWKRLNEVNPRSFYFSKIRVDPKDDQRVYRLGWTLGISDDGGKTWRAGGTRKPHGDLHAMLIDPEDSDHLLLGTDGGIYVSWDRAETWDYLNHVAAGEFYNVAVDMSDPYRIGGGLQDNGSWIGPSATLWDTGPEDMMSGPGAPAVGSGITNHDWWFINNGDGFHVAFDPVDRNICYAESQGGVLIRIDLASGLRRLIKPSPREGQPRFRFNWNAPFFISPHEPTTLYLGGNYVFKLTQRGDRWEKISGDLSTQALEKIESVGSDAETHCTCVSLAESPLARGQLWAGTDDGRVHVSVNDGGAWADVTPPEVAGRYVTKIEPSHHMRERCYVSVDGHRYDNMQPAVFMTEDLGKTWKSIVADLPKHSPVKVVREDRKNADVLYVGTEQAAYLSIDRGGHWVKLNGESLPTVAVDDLVQHPRDMDLIAGTHGRSIYVFDDGAVLSQLKPATLASELHVFEVAPARPRVYLDYQGFWGDRMFKAQNPPMGARICYWLREQDDEPVSVTITDSKGGLIRKLSGPNRPGLNRVVWDLQREPHDRFANPDAFLGQRDFVPAGEYRVSVKQDKRSSGAKITVLPAPKWSGAVGSGQ